MRIFLFLYPYRYFFQHELQLSRRMGKPPYFTLSPLNHLIDCRYRQLGYTVYWVLAGKPESLMAPDLSQLEPLVKTGPTDVFISSGVPYGVEDKWRYGRTRDVLAQLPSRITDLKVGGFHQWDCVNRIARAAYVRGLPVLVDEHLTDHFFCFHGLGDLIPDTCDYTFAGFGHVERWARDPMTLEHIRHMRKRRPWFAQ